MKFLLEHPELISYEAIPIDSRWRDALVLYCEVTSKESAERMAKFCWEEIKVMEFNDVIDESEQTMRSIHCLRFLTEAFKSRKDALSSFVTSLAKIVINKIRSGDNMLIRKYCVEITGLLPQEKMEQVLITAFSRGNLWLSEVAFKASRYLTVLQPNVGQKILFYLWTLNPIDLFERKKELFFLLKLSDAFKTVRKILKYRFLDLFLLTLGLILYSIVDVKSNLPLILLCFLSFLIPWALYIKHYYWLFVFSVFRSGPLIAHFLNIVGLGKVLSTPKIKSLSLISPEQSPDLYMLVLTLGALLIFPLIDSIIFFKRFKDQVTLKAIIRRWPGYLAILIAFAFSQSWTYLPPLLQSILRYIGLTLITLIGLAAVIGIFVLIKDFIKDLILLKKLRFDLQNKAILPRSQIEILLSKFKNSISRYHFIKILQNNSITATGYWTNNILPNFGDDMGSILLAKLEEKWLKIEK